MTEKQVFQDEYFTVLVDEQRGIVRTVRSSAAFPSIEELGVIFARLGGVLDALGRSRYGLLADLRAGPGRNDPEFEVVWCRTASSCRRRVACASRRCLRPRKQRWSGC